MKISGKLQGSFAAAGAAMVVVGGMAWWGLGALDDGRQLTQHADAIRIEMLEARRAEKDFFARKDLKYVAMVDSLMAAARAEAEDLRTRTDDPRIEQIAEGLSAYQAAFDEVAGMEVEKGLTPETGMQGQLRGAIHDVEEIIKGAKDYHLDALMLTLRRHEKDYMLRGDPKYITRFNEGVVEFQNAINASEYSGSVRQVRRP